MQNNNNRNKIREINEQKLHERLKGLTYTDNTVKNPIDDMIDNHDTAVEQQANVQTSIQNDNKETDAEQSTMSSLQDRFGVRKINRPVKDGQLTARIDSKTLTRFKDIVKMMYYPDKPNINETVTQIIRAFVEEYDKNNKEQKQ
jgi:hypothetical protein